jgi:hypothetical protein
MVKLKVNLNLQHAMKSQMGRVVKDMPPQIYLQETDPLPIT